MEHHHPIFSIIWGHGVRLEREIVFSLQWVYNKVVNIVSTFRVLGLFNTFQHKVSYILEIFCEEAIIFSHFLISDVNMGEYIHRCSTGFDLKEHSKKCPKNITW